MRKCRGNFSFLEIKTPGLLAGFSQPARCCQRNRRNWWALAPSVQRVKLSDLLRKSFSPYKGSMSMSPFPRGNKRGFFSKASPGKNRLSEELHQRHFSTKRGSCHPSLIAFVRKYQEDENAVSLTYLTEKFYSSWAELNVRINLKEEWRFIFDIRILRL